MISVRPLAGRHEFADAVNMQRIVWGWADLDILPVRFFVDPAPAHPTAFHNGALYSDPRISMYIGMGLRDEHMRRYIFTTSNGQEPDLEFTADTVACSPAGAREFTCPITGSFSVRGIARPFTVQLRVKEQGTSGFRAAGDTILKLSDYGIEPPSQFGVKPSNEVKLHLDFTGKENELSAKREGER